MQNSDPDFAPYLSSNPRIFKIRIFKPKLSFFEEKSQKLNKGFEEKLNKFLTYLNISKCDDEFFHEDCFVCAQCFQERVKKVSGQPLSGLNLLAALLSV